MGTDNVFGIHAAALTLRSRRAELLADNLANADTPGFKARDVDFDAVLAAQLGGETQMATTSAEHFSAGPDAVGGAEPLYRTPVQPSIDGNTVDTEVEQSAFMDNSLRYQTTLRFLEGRINSLRLAIRGE